MEAGSITFSTQLDNAKLEKELGRLEKKILRQMEDIGRVKFKKTDLEEQLNAANKALEELQRRVKVVNGNQVFEPGDLEQILELQKRIPQIEAEIKKCVDALHDANLELDYSKQRYGEIVQETEQIRSAEVDTGLKKLSKEAAETNKRLHELAEQYADLCEENDDFDPNEGKFLTLRQEIKNCVLYLDKLAVSGQLAELSSGAEIASDRIEDLTVKIRDLEDKLENLDLTDGEQEIMSAKVERGKELLETYQGVLDQVAEKQNEFDNAQQEGAQVRLNAYLENSCSLYQKMSSAIEKLRESSTVMQDMAEVTGGKLSGAFQIAGEAVGAFSTQLSGILSAAVPYVALAAVVVQALQKVVGALKNLAQAAVNNFRTAAKVIGDFSTAVAKSFVALLKSIGRWAAELSENFNVFSKLTEGLTQKLKGLGQMIRRVFVFSVITSGLRAIRTQMSAYLQVNTEFTTALRRLQGVLLTAFQPIYEVIVPALTTLINVLTHAAATVTQFFASLFGTTAKRAQANAEALYNQATATTAAGDAAEEAAKQLAGFDEINKLEGNRSAGGGGATSVDMGPLFDYEYDETPFDSWGEAFSAFLDRLLGGIPKLRDAFKDFADWLNGFSRKLYDMFTFPGVLDKVKQLGRDLAEALNSLVNWIDWELLGRALGAGLNLALNFLTSFLYAFDWMNLGRKLADFINGLASEIDWYEFGRLLWAGFKIGLETLAGFIVGLNMPLMAHAASQTVLGFFDEMKNTINRIPWAEIGQQIARFLNNIQWYDIITSALTAIGAAITALFTMVRGFIDTLQWSDIARQIYTAINGSIGKIDWRSIGKTLGDLFIHAFNFVRETIAGINWYQIGADIAAFINGIDWIGLLSSLAGAIAAGINAAVHTLGGLVANLDWRTIGEAIGNAVNRLVQDIDWESVGRTFSDALNGMIETATTLLETIDWNAIGRAIETFLSSIDWATLTTNIAKLIVDWLGLKLQLAVLKAQVFMEIGGHLIEGLKKGILIAIFNIAQWIKENIVDPIVNAVKNFFGIHSPSTVFAEIGQNLIAGLLQGISETWNSITEFFSTAVENLKQFFTDCWESIKTAASTAWEAIKATLSQTWDSLKEAATTVFTAIKDGIGEAWDNIREKTSSIWGSINSTLSEAWENLKTSAQEKFENIKQKITEVWTNVKQATVSTWESIKSDLSSKWESIKTAAVNAFDSIKEKITTAWNTVRSETAAKWEEIKSTLSNAWETLKSSAQEKFTGIKQAIIDKMNELKDHDWLSIGKSIMNGIWDGLKSVWDSVTSWISNAASSIANAFSSASSSARSGSFGTATQAGSFGGSSRIAIQSMPDIGDFEIPALAKGAVIPPNREFLAVLGDQKNGNNLEGPESSFEAAVMRGIQKGAVLAATGLLRLSYRLTGVSWAALCTRSTARKPSA